jgi:hypothetical protein
MIQRLWQPGDVVALHLPMPIRVQANEHQAAVIRGPLVYCLFQDAQNKKGTIYWHRGIYPEDQEIVLDLQNPAASNIEIPPAEGLLGPALRVRGRIMPRAPMFSTGEANAETLPAEPIECLLLPFANQGAIRGEYAVFIKYRNEPI